MDRLAPYIMFLLAGSLFIVFAGLFQLAVPMQGALILAEVGVMLGFALFMRHHWQAPRPMGWPSWRALGGPAWSAPVAFVAGGVFGLFANTLGALGTIFIPALREDALRYAESVEKMLSPGDPVLAGLAILSITVFAPLCEEALFRGTLLPLQRELEPPAVAAVFNGLIFSLLHMNTVGFVPLWLLGAVMASLTMRSSGLWIAILFHAGVNTCNGVLVPRVSRLVGVDPHDVTPELVEVLPASLALGVVSFALWRLLMGALSSPEAEA